MDDRHAQFLIAISELCAAAATAELPVELDTNDGHRLRGVPTPAPFSRGVGEIDDTGYGDPIQVDGIAVALETIRACTIRSPGLGQA